MAGARCGVALVVALTAGGLTPAVPAGAGHPLVVERLAGADRVGTAVAVSQAAFETADVVLLARADDFADALVASPLAAELDAPILLVGADALPAPVAAELDRLDAGEVVLLGGEAAVSGRVAEEVAATGRAVRRVGGEDRFATAAAVADELGPSSTAFVATGVDFPDALAAGPLAAALDAPILLATRDELPAVTDAALAAAAPAEIVVLGGTAAIGPGVEAALADDQATVRRLAGAHRYATAAAVFDAAVAAGADAADLWLATGATFPDALVAGAAVTATGGALLLAAGADLDASTAAVDRIHAAAPRRVRVLGGPAAVQGDVAARVDGIVHGTLLPGGGRVLFPTYRMVAFYGHARAPALGVLGEQPPDVVVDRLRAQAAGYAAGDRPLLLTFELIATVATRSPGADRLYRATAQPGEIQPYLDAARRHGLYLLLDIQPGRSDFLTEVRRYEAFLRQPDVGVALDPEWRMGPGEVPGQGVGAVHADEVNAVLDYLAGIVAEERLPEKLVVVHQFTSAMVRDRDAVRSPDGLAVTFHADGFGGRAAKLSKYEQLRGLPPFHSGLKLFYDEDSDLFQPDDVLRFAHVPDLVTYQ